jgi:hypothetical protein
MTSPIIPQQRYNYSDPLLNGKTGKHADMFRIQPFTVIRLTSKRIVIQFDGMRSNKIVGPSFFLNCKLIS